MSKNMLVALVVIAGGCSDPEDSYAKYKPRINTTLATHAAKLAPLMPQLDAADAPTRCASPQPDGKLVVLPREFAERMIKGELEALSRHDTPLMTNFLHRAMVGDVSPWTPSVFENSMEKLDKTTLTGIYITAKLDTGQISGRRIERAGHFEGSFWLLDLARKQVLVHTPITAKTGDMVMLHSDENPAAELADDLEYYIYKATTAALEAAGCGKHEPYTSQY